MQESGLRAVLVVPPWPRTGSANIFAATARAYSEAGVETAALVAFNPWDRGREPESRQPLLDAFELPGIPLIRGTTPARRLPRLASAAFYRGLRRRPDVLTERADEIAKARLDRDTVDFLARAPIDIVHVNHCHNVALALRVRRLAARIHGKSPLLVLSTHDIQASNPSVLMARGRFAGRASPEAIERGELRLCRAVDRLVHLATGDHEYFSAQIPERRHAFIPATLSPLTEDALRPLRQAPAGGEIVYVGTHQAANLRTLAWLLGDVLPLCPELGPRLRVYGRIGVAMEQRHPDLHRLHRAAFRGEVASLAEAYRSARVVLAPSFGGSGGSIKLLEAMCSGRAVLATSDAFRGIPPEWVAGSGVTSVDDAASFARALRLAIAAPEGRGAAAVYDRHFRSDLYARALTDFVLPGIEGARVGKGLVRGTGAAGED